MTRATNAAASPWGPAPPPPVRPDDLGDIAAAIGRADAYVAPSSLEPPPPPGTPRWPPNWTQAGADGAYGQAGRAFARAQGLVNAASRRLSELARRLDACRTAIERAEEVDRAVVVAALAERASLERQLAEARSSLTPLQRAADAAVAAIAGAEAQIRWLRRQWEAHDRALRGPDGNPHVAVAQQLALRDLPIVEEELRRLLGSDPFVDVPPFEERYDLPEWRQVAPGPSMVREMARALAGGGEPTPG